MHRILSLILLLGVFSLSAGVQAEMLWSMSYDDEHGSWGCAAHLMQDGEIVITGYIISLPEKMSDHFLIKSDKEGNIIWTRTVQDGDREISLFGELPKGLIPHIEPLELNGQDEIKVNPAVNDQNRSDQNLAPVIGIVDNLPVSGNVANTYLVNLTSYWNKFTDLLNSAQENLTSLIDN